VREFEAFVTEYEALEQLLGGYLNEDWADDYADPWQAVDDFPRSQPSYALKLRREVGNIIRQYPSENALFARLLRLGLGYRIQAAGWTSHREWLLAVADRVEEILRKSPAA
jgi:hypothetical protein